MLRFITAVGKALHPVIGGTLLPDGRILCPPRRGPNGAVMDDDMIRYITPGQRILGGWLRLPWLLMPVALFAFPAALGFPKGEVPLHPATNPGHLAFILSFLGYWLLLMGTALGIMRLSGTIDAQIYFPED